MEQRTLWRESSLAPLNIYRASPESRGARLHPWARHQHTSHQKDFPEIEKDLKCDIARNLIVVRTRRRITQTRMASLMGLSRAQWRKYESGTEMLRIDTAINWCLITGVSISRLFYGTVYSRQLKPVLCHNSLDDSSHILCHLDESAFAELTSSVCRVFGLPTVALRFVVPTPHVSIEAAQNELNTSLLARVGQGLKNFRLQRQLTQEQMAEALNISLSSYQQYEKAHAATRFSVACAARFIYVTQQDPLTLIRGSLTWQRLTTCNARIGLYAMLISQLPAERRPEFHCLVQRSWN